MSIVNWKIVHYVRLSSKTWDSGSELTDYRDVQVDLSLGSGKDRYNFKTNVIGPNINSEDKIVIYRRTDNGPFTDNDLLISGVVRTVTPNKTGSINDLSISGYNFSDSVMSGLVFVDATTLPVNEMLQQAISSLRLNNEVFTVSWNNSNPTTTTGGESFPLCNERLFNKPFSQILDKYVSQKKTGDGNYFWYVNSNNELTWGPITDAVTETFDESIIPMRTFKPTKDVNDVKNFVVIKGGLDADGRVIQSRYADYPSITKHGFKYYILADEAATTQTVQDIDKAMSGVNSMKDASYPVTPYWSKGVTYSNYDAYSIALRSYLRDELEDVGKAFVELRKNGKLKISIGLKPINNPYRIANRVLCNFLSDELPSNTILRVESINYTTQNDSLEFVEDIGSI